MADPAAEGELDHESHWDHLVEWLGHEFGAHAEAEDPDGLVIVFEGSPEECRIAALRIKTAGVLVLPDPTSTMGTRFSGDPYAASGVRGTPSPRVIGIAVRRPDVERAQAILADVEAI